MVADYSLIASLLSQASAAHAVYERTTLKGVRDKAWPDWYAAYLVEHGVADLINYAVTAAQLSRLLAEYDREYTHQKPDEDWPNYYARRIAAIFGR